MTLNQAVRRIQKIAESHGQVRAFFQGKVTDFLDDKGRKYVAVILQLNGGTISTTGKAATVSARLYVLDLVHIAADARSNELDVQSDCLSIALDLLAQIAYPKYDDWILSTDNSIQMLEEEMEDYLAGCYVDIAIRWPFTQNVCQVPTELTDYSPIDNDMKFVYDTIYVATGAEGKTLTIPDISGKKILLITRDSAILYKTSSAPDSTQYTWDFTSIGLGTDTGAGQKFLILWRNI